MKIRAIGRGPKMRCTLSLLMICTLLGLAPLPGNGQTSDPYQKLAATLGGLVHGEVMTVSVGNFLYEDTDLKSAFSDELRAKLERSLSQTTKFRVINREKLVEMQTESNYQGTLFLNPGSQTRGVRIQGIQAVLRGRFYYRYPDVTITAELAWLEGGKLEKVKVEISVKDVSAQIWPDGMTWDNPERIRAQLSLDDLLREEKPKVKFQATGRAPYPTESGLSDVLKRQTAARMAKVYALRELMELIGFIRIDSQSTVTINKGRPELKDEVTTVVQGYVSGATFSEPKFLKDDVEVEANIELNEIFCKEIKSVIR